MGAVPRHVVRRRLVVDDGRDGESVTGWPCDGTGRQCALSNVLDASADCWRGADRWSVDVHHGTIRAHAYPRRAVRWPDDYRGRRHG